LSYAFFDSPPIGFVSARDIPAPFCRSAECHRNALISNHPIHNSQPGWRLCRSRCGPASPQPLAWQQPLFFTSAIIRVVPRLFTLSIFGLILEFRWTGVLSHLANCHSAFVMLFTFCKVNCLYRAFPDAQSARESHPKVYLTPVFSVRWRQNK
jgi:hypothetical protein